MQKATEKAAELQSKLDAMEKEKAIYLTFLRIQGKAKHIAYSI